MAGIAPNLQLPSQPPAVKEVLNLEGGINGLLNNLNDCSNNNGSSGNVITPGMTVVSNSNSGGFAPPEMNITLTETGMLLFTLLCQRHLFQLFTHLLLLFSRRHDSGQAHS